MRLRAPLLLLVLLTAVPASGGSFPGFNGKIAFSSARDGNYEIYTMDDDASDQSRLTTSPQTDIDPDWSPDGKQIAFTSNRDGNDEIYVMNADGGGQRRLTTDAATDKNPTWSPGGRDIAFLSERDGNDEIYTIDADGGAPTRLTTNTADDTTPGWQALPVPKPPDDAVKQARFKGVWRESEYRGALELVGRVTRPAVLTLALRQGRRIRLSATMPLPGGAFRRSVPLPRGLFPASYLLDIGLVGSPEEKASQRMRMRLTAPPEGVVSQAWVSAVIGGLPAARFPRSTWLVASHFRFSALPRPGRAVVVSWYDPSGALARAIRKPRAQAIAAFLATRDHSPMPPGSWQVVLRAGPVVVKRVRYRIG